MLMQCMYVYIRNERVDFLFQHQDLLILLPTANQKHMYVLQLQLMHTRSQCIH